jgi:hypothetical protein
MDFFRQRGQARVTGHHKDLTNAKGHMDAGSKLHLFYTLSFLKLANAFDSPQITAL